jgi:hypothetical protein
VTAFNPVGGGGSAIRDLWRYMTVLASVLIVTVIPYQRRYNPNKFFTVTRPPKPPQEAVRGRLRERSHRTLPSV